jgi:hypothetical protein
MVLGREKEPRSSRREWLGGAPSRSFVFGRNLRLRPARKGKPPVAVSQIVSQLDHLQAQPAWSEAFRRQHDERLDENLSARPVQPPPRNHQHLENAADHWSIGSRGSSFWSVSPPLEKGVARQDLVAKHTPWTVQPPPPQPEELL